MSANGIITFFLWVILVLGTFVGCIVYLYYGKLWFRTKVTSVSVPIGRMMRMTLRGASAYRIVNGYVDAMTESIDVDLEELERFDRSRGDVRKVIRGMIAAKGRGRSLSFGEACTLELQGKDMLQEVEQSEQF